MAKPWSLMLSLNGIRAVFHRPHPEKETDKGALKSMRLFKDMMAYKNYIAHVVFDDEADLFHGEVINTRDVITFQGKSVKELKKSFHDSVDDYLEFCNTRFFAR